MEAIGFFELLVPIYRTSRRHIRENGDLDTHRRDNLKSQVSDLFDSKEIGVLVYRY